MTIPRRGGGHPLPPGAGDPTAPPSPAAHEPRISVVIPVKDDATLLVRCLQALAAQDRVADEIIVVDNGSTDDSAALAEAAGARVLRCDAPGIPAAASTGYDAARGDLILRLDADCVPGPGWVDAVAAAFAADAEVAALTGPARFTDGPAVLRGPLAMVYLGAYAALLGLTLGHPPLFGSNLAFRREAWQAVRGEVHRDDPDLHDDLDLAFHLGTAHRIGVLPEAHMGMSMRPFTDGQFRRRVHRGYRSVVVHWPHDFPPRRWRRLVADRLRRHAARRTAA